MMPRLDQQRRAFALAHQVFTADGGSIHNASRHTRLDVLPRIDLDQVLASPRTRTNP